MQETILIVEDDRSLATTLRDRLLYEGYRVDTAADGLDALHTACTSPVDLIILGISSPRINGLAVTRELRGRGITTPILLLTIQDDVVDNTVGLKVGANGCLTKPFEIAHLLSQIESLLRGDGRPSNIGFYQFGAIGVDLDRSQVTKNGRHVYLTGREFQLLCYLVEHAGDIITREELLRAVWGYSTHTSTRTVDTHVRTIRQKLEETPHRPSLILTVSRFGYKLVRPHRN
jgi:DNA-binding response OmpR family regulator